MSKPQQLELIELPPRIKVGESFGRTRVSYSTPDPTPKEPDKVTWRVGTVKAIAPDGMAAVDIGLTGMPMVRLEDLQSPF